MHRLRQPSLLGLPLVLAACVVSGWAFGQGPKPPPPGPGGPPPQARPSYTEPLMKPPAFDLEALGMIEAERRQHANSLAGFALSALSRHADAEGRLANVPPEKWLLARKLVGLALHLDARCKAAIVANGRLRSGVIGAAPAEAGMSPEAFSSFLVGRADELVKAGGADNIRLAGYFLDLAMALDRKNDDAVYAFEVFKLDGHQVDWRPILGGE